MPAARRLCRQRGRYRQSPLQAPDPRKSRGVRELAHPYRGVQPSRMPGFKGTAPTYPRRPARVLHAQRHESLARKSIGQSFGRPGQRAPCVKRAHQNNKGSSRRSSACSSQVRGHQSVTGIARAILGWHRVEGDDLHLGALRPQVANLPQEGEHRGTRTAVMLLANPKRTGLGRVAEVPLGATRQVSVDGGLLARRNLNAQQDGRSRTRQGAGQGSGECRTLSRAVKLAKNNDFRGTDPCRNGIGRQAGGLGTGRQSEQEENAGEETTKNGGRAIWIVFKKTNPCSPNVRQSTLLASCRGEYRGHIDDSFH